MNYLKYKKYKNKYKSLIAGYSNINCKGYINKQCPPGCYKVNVKKKGFTYCRKNKKSKQSSLSQNNQDKKDDHISLIIDEDEDEDEGIVTSPSKEGIIRKFGHLTVKNVDGGSISIVDLEMINYLQNYGFELSRIEFLLDNFSENISELIEIFQLRKPIWLYFLLNINQITNYPSYDSKKIMLDPSFYEESFKDNFIQNSKELASGTEGIVYKLKFKGSSKWDYTVKVTAEKMNFRNPILLIETLEMMAFYQMLSKFEIGPKIIPDKSFYLNLPGGDYKLITKRYSGSLDEYFKKYNVTQNLESKIIILIEKMLDLGIICVDQKPGNILLDWNKDGIIKNIVLTDFGRDWCCQSKISGNCEYLNKSEDTVDNKTNFLAIKNNRLFMKLIILLSISITTLNKHEKKIFESQLQELLGYLDTIEFQDFFRIVCNNELTRCESIYPPFYYLMGKKTSEKNLIKDIREFILKVIN